LVSLRSLCLFGVLVLLALPAVAASDGQLSSADREHYKNAFLHFDRGNYRDAALHAARAKNQLPAKVVRWLLLTRSDSDADYQDAAEFFAENPDWPRQTSLQRAVERAMPLSTPDAEILAWFERRPPASVDGAMKLAGALLRAGREAEAQALVRETWRNGDFDRELERNFHDLYKRLLADEDHIARLDRLLWRENAGAARQQAKRLGSGYPQLAEARLALAQMSPGVDGAIRRVPKVLRDDAGLIYERARWRMRKERYDDVAEMLDPPDPDLPNAEAWWPVRRWLAEEALERGDLERAYRVASQHGISEGSKFAEAEWLAGWTALRFLKQPQRAYKHFTQLYYGSTSPISQGRGGYWAGEAARATGNEDWAKQWYEAAAEHGTTFYGQLAALRLSQRPSVTFEGAPRPSEEQRRAFAESEIVQVIRLLGELRQRDTQATFLYHLNELSVNAESYVLAAELAHDVGRPEIAVWLAKQARNDGILLTSELFPAPISPKTKSTEEALVLAIIRQESAFDTWAVSGAGARGLMQLMPATAKNVAKSLRLSFDKNSLNRDPDYNLRLGTAYLERLLDRYRGSHVLALAAYNAGPGRVSQWIRAHGDPREPGADPIDWIERIPFAETRNYVQRVLETLVVYRERLGTGHTDLPLGPATAELGQEQ